MAKNKKTQSEQFDIKLQYGSWQIKVKTALAKYSEYYLPVLAGAIILAVIIAHLQFFTRKSMYLPMGIVGCLAWLLIIFTKDVFPQKLKEDDEEKYICSFVRAGVILSVYWAWELTDILTLAISLKEVKVISLLSLFCYFIFGLIICFSKNVSLVETISHFNIYQQNGQDSIEPGDIVLGEEIDKDTEKDTGKQVIARCKDRFVHTIIYGPTGSGKTSQILGPMSYQDLQNPNIGVIVLEPKGDFAEQVYARAKYLGRQKVTYFNPTLPNCPFFNPLFGDETDVVENLTTAFAAMDTTANSYFKNNTELLLRNTIKVVKRVYGNDATLNDMLVLMNDLNGEGEKMLKTFHQHNASVTDALLKKENDNIYYYFTNDYYTGLRGEKGASKTYQDSSSVRTQIQKLVSNPYLARVLMPPATSKLEEGQYLDFDRVLENGEVLCLCSAQGTLRDMGTYLGYFLILTLQSAIFRRKGDEWSRRGCILYIDEFQKYSNNSMADLLTQGRSYRVACVFATQNRALINSGGDAGAQFLQNVSTNCRNIIVLPGCSAEDAKYFSLEFGTELVKKEKKSFSTRAYVPKVVGFDSARETTSVDEKEEPLFSPSDLQYGKFGNVVIRTIEKNSVMRPRAVRVNFVDRSVDKESAKFLYAIKKEEPKEREIPKIIATKEDGDNSSMPLSAPSSSEPDLTDFDDKDINSIKNSTSHFSDNSETSSNEDDDDYHDCAQYEDEQDDIEQEDMDLDFVNKDSEDFDI